MKKNLIYALLTGAMVLCVTGCGKKADTAADTENVQIANPFVDYDSLEEAEAAAGFDITAPETMDGRSISLIQVMDSDDGEIFIQITYGDYENEDDFMIRKGIGTDAETLSGYNFEDPATESAEVDGNSIQITGEDGKMYTATWNNGDYAYALIATPGTESDVLVELAAEVL